MSPVWMMSLEKAASTGLRRSTISAGPPTKESSVPSSAAQPPRHIVASTTCRPCSAAALRKLRAPFPDAPWREWRRPCRGGRASAGRARRAARAAPGRSPRRSGSRRASAASAARSSTHFPPRYSTAARFAASTSCTRHVKPLRARCPMIGCPMRPAPITPTSSIRKRARVLKDAAHRNPLPRPVERGSCAMASSSESSRGTTIDIARALLHLRDRAPAARRRARPPPPPRAAAAAP